MVFFSQNGDTVGDAAWRCNVDAVARTGKRACIWAKCLIPTEKSAILVCSNATEPMFPDTSEASDAKFAGCQASHYFFELVCV